MADQRLKDRESQVDDDEQAEGGNEPAIEVTHDKDGNATVDVPGPSKAELRHKRWAERVGGVLDERNKPLMESVEHMKRTIEGLNASLARMGQPARRQEVDTEEPSETERKFNEARDRQSEILKILPTCRTQPEIDKLEREYKKLDLEAVRAVQRETETRIESSRRNSPAPNPEMAVIQSEFPDVIANPKAAGWASAAFQQAVIEADGQPFNRMEAHRRVLSEAATRFGIRKAPLPPARAHEQARFGGAPPASGAGGATRGGARLSKEQQEIARSRYKDMEPAEADRKWAESMVRRDPHFFG
jgi:hypothetical protein